MKYEVRWKELWASLAKYMTIVIVSSITAVLVIRFFKAGFSYEAVFKHLTPIGYIGLILGILMFSVASAGFISIFFKLASITIEKEVITGRNYWGVKKS